MRAVGRTERAPTARPCFAQQEAGARPNFKMKVKNHSFVMFNFFLQKTLRVGNFLSLKEVYVLVKVSNE